jgi:phosphoribosylformylglycinamidine synthase
MCVVDDVRKCVTMDLKEAGDLLVLVGVTRPEMGGSHFGLVRRAAGGPAGIVPRVRLDEARAAMDGVHRAISAGLVRACHDLSEGGAAVALAEMAFAGGLGAEASLLHAPYEEGPDAAGVRDEVLLFAESPSRFVCEVRERDLAAFRTALGGVPCAPVGRVTGGGRLVLRGVHDAVVVDEPIEALRDAFTRPLRHGGAR